MPHTHVTTTTTTRAEAISPETATAMSLPDAPRALFGRRLSIGLLQAGLLSLMLLAATSKSGFADRGMLFIPLMLIVCYVPPIAALGLGQLAPRRLVLWCAVFAAVLAVIGAHDGWRNRHTGMPPGVTDTGPFDWHMPSFALMWGAAAIVYLGYVLVTARERSGKRVAPYAIYFVFSWSLALQVGLALLFSGLLQLILHVGGSLFSMVGLPLMRDLIDAPQIGLPIVALAFIVGLHIADVRADFIRALQTLSLTLMAWLLPPLVLIAAAFLASLPFVGLAPLWATHSATSLLLGTAALIVVLVNAVFASGNGASPRLLHVAARLGCLLLPIIVALAGYALSLRIGQYGLTAWRVLSVAAVCIAACYSLGYGAAGLARDRTLGRIAPTNIATVWAMLAAIVALLTPVADPARLAVGSQMERLVAGRIAPDKFDFYFLQGAPDIYSRRAWTRLKAGNALGPNAAAIAARVAEAQRLGDGPKSPPPDKTTLARNLVSHTPRVPLPPSFIATDWTKRAEQEWLPRCLTSAEVRCDAFLIDLTGDGQRDVLVLPADDDSGVVFGLDAHGVWQDIARFELGPACTGLRDALVAGKVHTVAPPMRDLEVNGQRIHVVPNREVQSCR